MRADRLALLRARKKSFSVSLAPRARGLVRSQFPETPKRIGAPESPNPGRTCTGLTPHGDFTLSHQAKFIREPDAAACDGLRAGAAAVGAALVRIALAKDEPIPGCAHSRPVQRSVMAKQKAPKKDFAQNALATVLKATGAKTLKPDNVERVTFGAKRAAKRPKRA